METNCVWAHEVEEDDYLVIDGECVGQVIVVSDETDLILFGAKDDEGEYTEWPFAPFDPVSIVASFDSEPVPEID